MNGLSNDDILALISKTRTRNQYEPKAVDFLASDEAAISVKDVWPVEFAAKNPSTLYQGFLNASKKLTDEQRSLLLVKQHADNVFLLNKSKLALLLADAPDHAE